MAHEPVDEFKASLRQAAHRARAELTPHYRDEAGSLVAEIFFQNIALSPADTVAGYWRIRDEIDCQPILKRLQMTAQRVILPVVVGRDQPLDLRVWEPGAELVGAGFGTYAPPETAPRALPDVLLIPLLGFDKQGTRLGYGGGYYDRTLASLPNRPRIIGLAYAAQELQYIPREDHDVPLDAVITETGLRMFGDFL